MRFVTTCLKSAKATVQAFIADHATVFAAAISFYAIISLAPLLVIVVAVAGIAVAGSLLVLLMWIYYSALTVLLGAEFTKVFMRNGEGSVHASGAAAVEKP